MVKKPIHRVWWGVSMTGNNKTTEILGSGWCTDGKLALLPSCVTPWPAVFATRREARDMAKTLTKKFLYLRPGHMWIFHPTRLDVAIRVTR